MARFTEARGMGDGLPSFAPQWLKSGSSATLGAGTHSSSSTATRGLYLWTYKRPPADYRNIQIMTLQCIGCRGSIQELA